jgi:hypothetical protein
MSTYDRILVALLAVACVSLLVLAAEAAVRFFVNF